jgi:hypothetical protein
LEKDFTFKIKPQYIGILSNKFSKIDINNVDTEIYLEFESSLAPLCKLNNFLYIVKVAKEINDITTTEGNLLYIWVIIHHRWFLHKSIANNHMYENVNNGVIGQFTKDTEERYITHMKPQQKLYSQKHLKRYTNLNLVKFWNFVRIMKTKINTQR